MLTQQITALSEYWVDQKDGGQFSSTSHLLLGRKWKHNWSNASDISLSFSTAESHICTCIKPQAACSSASCMDIWKVSSTEDRIPHPASTESKCTQPQSVPSPQHLWCHMSLTAQTAHWGIRMRYLSTNYRISSAAAAQNRYLHLPYSPPCLYLPK